MATYPNVSARKIAETLRLDHHFILRRRRVIDRANAEEIKRMTVEQNLAEVTMFLEAVVPTISGIIFNKDSKDKDKISATKTLIEGKLKLLSAKFDAGIFERQLGKLKTDTSLGDEEKELIAQALQYAFNTDKPTKDNRGSTE